MADGRHFENGLLLYLSRESSDLNEAWCADADFGPKNGHVTKCENFTNSKFKMAEGRHIRNRFWLYLNV